MDIHERFVPLVARAAEIGAFVCMAIPLEIVVGGGCRQGEIVAAISTAREAAPAWRGLPARERAEFLFPV